MPSSLRITAIVAAYNEEDIIENVIRGLIGEGVSVYLIDNRSTDGTVAAVEPFLGRGVIGLERFPETGGDATHFNWHHILRRKEEIARTIDSDWLIHHDADEFRESPWNDTTLSEGIARVDEAEYNAIDFAVFNFPPTGQIFHRGDDIRDVFRFYEVGQAFDRTQIKAWKNNGQSVDLTSSGGHDATFEGRRVFPIRFILRHYPIRGQSHGERKVFGERKPRFTPDERALGWHVQYDDVSEGHSFERAPENLREFDITRIRLDLQLHHRYVEELEARVLELDHLRGMLERDASHVTREIEQLRQASAIERTRSEALVAQVTALAAEINAEREAAANARRGLHDALAAAERVGMSLRDRQLQVEDLSRRLDAVFQSRSWKATAPLRALQRLMTGR